MSWHHGDEVEGCAGHYDWPRVPMDEYRHHHDGDKRLWCSGPDCPHCAAGLTFYASCTHSYDCSITGHDCHPKPKLPTTTTKRRRRRRPINQTPVPLDEHGEPIY